MDFSTAASALSSVQNLSYLIVFLLIFVEGSITNYVAAFAASLGYFNVFIIFSLAIAGNFIGDVIFYSLGRAGKKTFLKKHFGKATHSIKAKKLAAYLHRHPWKAMLIIKVTPWLPTPGLILAGIVKMPLKKFLSYSLLICTITAVIVTFLGYYSGALFSLLYTYAKYGAYLAGALVVLCICAWFGIRFLQKRVAKKIGKI
jgi:membrane protein DedA with SNARE-associated domain